MAFPSPPRRKRHIRFRQILPRRTNSVKIQPVEDVEYRAQRGLRLTDTGIESRRLRTKVIAWTQIRDVQVVNRVTVAQLAVMGSRASGRRSTRSGGGARKLSSVRVQQANGRWRELPVPVAWENAPDPEFTRKAEEIKERWRAAINQAAAR
jgi:hypothetical protein